MIGCEPPFEQMGTGLKCSIFEQNKPVPICSNSNFDIIKVHVVLKGINKLPSSDMGVRSSPLLRVPQKPFPPVGPHGFRGHLTRLTLCVAIAIPSVRRDAIGAERSNRWTFGSGTLIRFHPRGVKISEFRDSSAGTRSEASVSAFSRREEEQPRDRRAVRRKAA